jgi:hypothetical protein
MRVLKAARYDCARELGALGLVIYAVALIIKAAFRVPRVDVAIAKVSIRVCPCAWTTKVEESLRLRSMQCEQHLCHPFCFGPAALRYYLILVVYLLQKISSRWFFFR